MYREKLQLEIAAREKAERKQQEYEERIKNMQDEMEKRQQDLQEAQVIPINLLVSLKVLSTDWIYATIIHTLLLN